MVRGGNMRRSQIVLRACVGVITAAMAFARSASAQHPPRDLARELDLKIKEPFTVTAVGDIITNRPVTMSKDAGLQRFVDLVRSPDVSVSTSRPTSTTKSAATS